MPNRGPGKLTYRGAGVDIDAGDALVERIKPHVRRTLRPEVMTDLGGFAGLCALPDALQGAAAGVVHRRRRHQAEARVPDRAARHGRHRPGRDERQRHGRLRRRAAALPRLLRRPASWTSASPSGSSRASPTAARRPAARWSAARPPSCRASTPTASTTWPGFCVGVVENEPPASTGAPSAPGDRLLGLASSGFHSNGYSLVRRVFLDHMRCRWTRRRPGSTSRWPPRCCARRASTCARCARCTTPACCAGPPTSPAAAWSTTRRACCRPTRA